jgi:ribosomal protein S18 acetylase RimI-like enzyme
MGGPGEPAAVDPPRPSEVRLPGRVAVGPPGPSVPSAGDQAGVAPAGGPFVRPYRPTDLGDVYDVCVRTGDAGEDATGKFDPPELLGDIYVGPYLEHEPRLAFVLDAGGRAVGYVLGAADTPAFVRWYRTSWLPRLAGRYPAPPKHPRNATERLLTVLYDPERMWRPELAPYPAHLHIDILPAYQGVGHGRHLMEAFFRAAAAAGAPAVHLGVAATNTRAIGFYRRLGFEEIEVTGGIAGGLLLGRPTS